jgi:hypothetical protein
VLHYDIVDASVRLPCGVGVRAMPNNCIRYLGPHYSWYTPGIRVHSHEPAWMTALMLAHQSRADWRWSACGVGCADIYA